MTNDLISRSAVLEKQTYMYDEALGTSPCVLTEDIESAPAVDAVKVVRCKDCIHYEKYPDYANECWNNSGMLNVYDDGFCSHGERRSE